MEGNEKIHLVVICSLRLSAAEAASRRRRPSTHMLIRTPASRCRKSRRRYPKTWSSSTSASRRSSATVTLGRREARRRANRPLSKLLVSISNLFCQQPNAHNSLFSAVFLLNCKFVNMTMRALHFDSNPTQSDRGKTFVRFTTEWARLKINCVATN